jgi:hypothetical protein
VVDVAAVSTEAASPSATVSDSLAPAAATESPSLEVKEEKLPLHTETPTLLEEAGKKEEVKPAETKPEEKVEAKPEEKDLLSQQITYTDFELPEGFKLEGEQLNQFKEVLNKHHLSQEGGQELLNLHTSLFQKYSENTLAEQHRVFGEMRKSWQAAVMADEQLGGSGHQTTMRAIARMRDLFVPEKDRASFDEFLRITGAGDHPAFLRLLHNAARRFDEPAPPAALGQPVPQPKKNGRGSPLYDHPTSNVLR